MDLGDLPFDMPKLRRRLRMNQSNEPAAGFSNQEPNPATSAGHMMIPVPTGAALSTGESSEISQASSSHSVRDEAKMNLSKYQRRRGELLQEKERDGCMT